MSLIRPNRPNRLPLPFIDVGLFLLALLPRAYALQRFVTADEAKWVYRSAQFLAALLQGDLAATSVNLTPAVTTTWLGSLGLGLHYALHRGSLNLSPVEWLLSLPQYRTELDILAAVRWPVVILAALGVVAIYRLARSLFDPTLALIAAALLALDPHTIALSRVLGHDAPATLFMNLSLLLLLLAVKPQQAHPTRLFILSGLAAGLAFLSKAPALFLIPFAGLVYIVTVGRNIDTLYFWLKRFLLWAVVAYLAFVIGWPAAWIKPLDRPLAVVQNAFLSATDEEEAEAEGYWQVPDLGPLYYPVHGAFKLSPLVTVGLGLAAILALKRRRGAAPPAQASLLWLLAFALLFTLFMTLGQKRSPRYILPAFTPLILIATFGWLRLAKIAGSQARLPALFGGILVFSALVSLLPYAPYYFTYYNPLLGGPYTAPRLVKIGWGEGLDRVGRFLQRSTATRDSRVGTTYASTLAPFFSGDLSGLADPHLDYLVLYIKPRQSGNPSPTFIRYFEYLGPIFSVELNGIHYADVYPGPAIQPSLALTPGLDQAILPLPTGFRPHTPYGHIGDMLTVDVLWLAERTGLPTEPSTVTLEPISALDSLLEHSHPGDGSESPPRTILAQGEGHLAQPADNLVISRHHLALPPELERGPYALRVDGRPLGEIELRHFQPPAHLNPVEGLIFGQQIGLVGYQFEPGQEYIDVTLAWQAQKARLPDYTVFVQLLDAETNRRLTGVDTQPQQGTGQWAKNEVVVDRYRLALPPDLPPGYYKIIVGLYRPQSGHRLALPDGQDHWPLPWTLRRKQPF